MGCRVSYNSNSDFIRSILYAITTTPSLRELYESLVLKGGVALNLRWESGRMSRKDMDFGLLHKNHRLTQRDFENLLVALQDWTAAPKNSRDIVSVGESVDTPVMSYIHPITQERGELKLQTSGIQVPPVLEAEMASRGTTRFTTYDGKSFVFRVMRLEEIAGEKMCRLWRPDKHPARLVDLYDIGFCTEQPDFMPIDVEMVIRRRRKTSEGNHIKISKSMTEVRRVGRNPTSEVVTARKTALYGPKVTDETIVRRSNAGLAFVENMVERLSR